MILIQYQFTFKFDHPERVQLSNDEVKMILHCYA
jgi:hypothetical protein